MNTCADSRTDVKAVQSIVDRFAAERGRVRILDAGCGAKSPVRPPDGSFVLGVDSSQAQLARNESLTEAVVGDLESVYLPERDFDLVVCWQVLEHLPNPECVLDRLVRAAKSGGLIIVGVPNVMSLKGLATKFTPHVVHVWAYRRLFGRPSAGTGDQAPFPTYMRRSIHPTALEAYARRQGLVIERAWFSESSFQRSLRARLHLPPSVWRAFAVGIHALSVGRLSAEKTEFTIVFRKAS